MRSLSVLSALVFMFLTGCSSSNEQAGNDVSGFPEAEIITAEDLEVVISTESELMYTPTKFELLDSATFVIYDQDLSKFMYFDLDGNKSHEFGTVGRGPGEYDASSGLSHLKLIDGKLQGLDVYQFRINQYSKNGEFIEDFNYVTNEVYKFNDLEFLSNRKILQATNGRDSTLAVIRNLDTGQVEQRIGTTDGESIPLFSPEEERRAYADNEIPLAHKYEAIVSKKEDGFFLFMNSTGTLNTFNNDGELINSVSLPDSVKEPIRNLNVQRNIDAGTDSWVVSPLEYILDMKVFGDKVFMLMRDFDEENVFETRLFAADQQGNFIKHYIIERPDDSTYFYNFAVTNDGMIYLLDAMGARLFKYTPE